MRAAALLVCAAGAAASDKWAPLDGLLKGWQFTDDFVVSVGVLEPSGSVKQVFLHEHGNMTTGTSVETGSTSKWPMAMMLAGAVADGSIASLDDPVHKYVKWWTSDQSDRRSRVTLNHLLSFTSGFGGGHPGDNVDATSPLERRKSARRQFLRAQRPVANGSAACINDPKGDYLSCARTIYEVIGGPGGINITGEPGTVYSYNSYHLQLAGAVVSSATGLSIQQILEKYLVKAYGMASSYCQGPNPQLAACLWTTPGDYGRFLAATLGKTVLPASIIDVSEQDHTPFLAKTYTLYGDYAYGHFLSCFDSIAGFTDACREARVHADPGAFGYYPLIDLRYGYYLQVAAYEHTAVTYPRSGIPEYLMQLIKPMVDAIIQGKDISMTSAHSTPEFWRADLVDINYVAGCYLHPASCV